MKNIRIYKDDIRTHILRSLLFTDTAILIGGIIIIASAIYGLFFYGIHLYDWRYYLSTVFVSIVIFLIFITQKIDNQPIFKIIPRAIIHRFSKKNQRFKSINPYFTNFSIQDNHIIRSNSIIRVYQVEPYDIALLNNQDRESYFTKLKQAIHTLPIPIQILVKKEVAQSSNYSKHIFSVYDSSNSNTESLVQKYVNDLTELIDNHTLFITKYYLIIKIKCNPHNPYSRIEAIKKLNDIGLNFCSSLFNCQINITPTSNDELISLAKQILR